MASYRANSQIMGTPQQIQGIQAHQDFLGQRDDSNKERKIHRQPNYNIHLINDEMMDVLKVLNPEKEQNKVQDANRQETKDLF